MKTYIKRTLENRIKEYVKSFPAVSLTGPRQSGKTTCLKHIFGVEYGYVSLDTLKNREIAIKDPDLFVKNLPEKVIIDELQYAPDVMSYLKIEIDNDRDRRGRYILTGSQNFLLMKSFSESLAGRIGILRMYPLCANEIAAYKGLNTTKDLFEFSALSGTYPETTVKKDMLLEAWYEGYISTYLERDVRNLYDIGNLLTFERFISILAVRPGQLLNMNSMASDLSVSVNTVKKWLSILEASGIIFILPPYHANIRTRLVKTPKVYFYDTGLICYYNNIKNSGELYKHALLGNIFENYCIAEAVKHLNNTGVRKSLCSFFRTSDGTEIDFVVEAKDGLKLYEIKASMLVHMDAARNIELFTSNKKSIPISSALVVSLKDDDSVLTRNSRLTGLFGMLKSL